MHINGAIIILLIEDNILTKVAYKDWPKKLYIFQHTVYLEPFKKKRTDFTIMLQEFLATKIRL